MPLFPAGAMAVPVAGVVGIAVPPIVVTIPPLGLATPHAHVAKERSHTERADITIGGE
jgi:hypothetical protein